VVNYKEIIKVYESKKNEYETMSNELKKMEEELEILRRVLQEYEKIRGNNVLQTQPATDNISQENSE
jgi:predicted translin family RNA/ssDNA-binding protein